MQKIILGDINIDYALKAQGKLHMFHDIAKSEIEKTAVIQAFEYCYEISWKLMKRILSKKGIEITSPRDAFREAANNNLIPSAKIWFEYIIIRNQTVHTYNEIIVDKIFNSIGDFRSEFDEFIDRIRKL